MQNNVKHELTLNENPKNSHVYREQPSKQIIKLTISLFASNLETNYQQINFHMEMEPRNCSFVFLGILCLKQRFTTKQF